MMMRPLGRGIIHLKGMSLKGKEEWKDVSLPRMGGGVGSGSGPGDVLGKEGVPVRGRNGGPVGAGVGGRMRSPPGNGQKGKTRDNVDYAAVNNGTSQPTTTNSSTSAASRTLTGSWTGHDDAASGAGYHSHERDEAGLMGHDDHRVSSGCHFRRGYVMDRS